MTETATQIADGDLSVRVPEGAPGTEPGQLADQALSLVGERDYGRCGSRALGVGDHDHTANGDTRAHRRRE